MNLMWLLTFEFVFFFDKATQMHASLMSQVETIEIARELSSPGLLDVLQINLNFQLTEMDIMAKKNPL